MSASRPSNSSTVGRVPPTVKPEDGGPQKLGTTSKPSNSSTVSHLPPTFKPEEGGPQKLSTKRRSTDAADKIILNSIEQEVMHGSVCC